MLNGDSLPLISPFGFFLLPPPVLLPKGEMSRFLVPGIEITPLAGAQRETWAKIEKG